MYWVDSSIRFKTNNTDIIFKKATETGGIALSIKSIHFVFSVTMKETVRYLLTNMERQKSTLVSGSGNMLIYRTREVYENIIKWGVLCSLEEECIAKGSQHCTFSHQKDTWAHCSRFDQTVINILCSNYYGFNRKEYTATDTLFEVKRGLSGYRDAKSC